MKIRTQSQPRKPHKKRQLEVVDLCSDDSDETHVTFVPNIPKKAAPPFNQKLPIRSQSQGNNISSQVSEANSECLFDVGSHGLSPFVWEIDIKSDKLLVLKYGTNHCKALNGRILSENLRKPGVLNLKKLQASDQKLVEMQNNQAASVSIYQRSQNSCRKSPVK